MVQGLNLDLRSEFFNDTAQCKPCISVLAKSSPSLEPIPLCGSDPLHTASIAQVKDFKLTVS